MSGHRKLATEHRALVLESVATSPNATKQAIFADCVSHSFTKDAADVMIWQLRRIGLIGRSDSDTYFITKAGLDYLQSADFTRIVPEFAPRPKARRKAKPAKPLWDSGEF